MGAAPDVLAMAVAALKTERPLLNVRILGETSDQVVQLLHRREVDLALGAIHHSAAAQRLPLRTACARNAASSSCGHAIRSRGGRRYRLPSSSQWPWVVQPITSPARVLFEEELARAGLNTPSNLTECAIDFRDAAVARNLRRVAMLPESVVRDHVRGQAARRAADRDRQEPPGLWHPRAQAGSTVRGRASLHRSIAALFAADYSMLLLPKSLQIDEQPAIDEQRGTGDIAREVRGEEHHAVGHFVGRA